MATVTPENVDVDVHRFWKDGFLILRDMYPASYFEEMREAIIASDSARKRSGQPAPDCLADPLLSRFIYDRRLVQVAKAILKTNDIHYFGDSNYAIVGETYKPGVHVGGWHRDNTDREDLSLPDWQSPYSLIRFGFYLQDHRHHSGGLLVRKGSHNQIKTRWSALFSERYINNAMGDVGVWSMRIDHAGVGRRLKVLGAPVGPRFQKVLPEAMLSPYTPTTRIGFWTAYARASDHLDRYCEYMLGRSERLDMWQNTYYSPETLAACKDAGLGIVDMPARMRQRIAEGKPVGQHKHHYHLAG